ncbi:MAG: hypothetical protein RLZZ574_3489, partial [Cyanobacteriota bacterium]
FISNNSNNESIAILSGVSADAINATFSLKLSSMIN